MAIAQRTQMPLEPAEFKAAMGRFGSGITVITVADEEGMHGMTASAFCSLSLDPPLILVCVSKKAKMHALIKKGTAFGINILAADQQSVSNRFAGWWEEGRSKWADLGLETSPISGAPWIAGSLACLDCQLEQALPGGDHSIFVGRVLAVSVGDAPTNELHPLIWFSSRYRQLAGAQ